MKLNVSRIAQLAKLPITSGEGKKLEKQLVETLEYIDRLSEINTTDVKPTAHVTGLENVTREDKAAPSLTQQQALANAKKTHEGSFQVNAVLDNE